MAEDDGLASYRVPRNVMSKLSPIAELSEDESLKTHRDAPSAEISSPKFHLDLSFADCESAKIEGPGSVSFRVRASDIKNEETFSDAPTVESVTTDFPADESLNTHRDSSAVECESEMAQDDGSVSYRVSDKKVMSKLSPIAELSEDKSLKTHRDAPSAEITSPKFHLDLLFADSESARTEGPGRIWLQDGPSRITALAWSPNNLKLGVATSDRTILLFNEKGERKDKFGLKPIDSKYGKKSFAVKGLAFSPDSAKLAVGQTDNIVYVYKIGEDWGDKKVICNKFLPSAAVTALIWLTEGPLVFGTADGKVRLGNHKTNKMSTLYTTESFVVSLASNTRGTAFLAGHADGTIVRYYVVDEADMETQGRVATHSVPPYALAWPLNHILAAGCDRKLTLFDKDGRVNRVFDFSREDEKEFTIACCSPSGQAVAIGSYDRIRVISWSPAKMAWEENPAKEIRNLYTVTALAWRRDGSRVACGSLCGGIFIFESVLKRSVWKNKFEMTYVGPSQVLVKPLTGEGRGVILKSQLGHEIDDVRIMGRDCYLVARTSHTLLLGDLMRNLLSEVAWPSSGRNEKFYFDNPTVCLIFNAGELSLVEYGENDIMGSVRTDLMNPHLISVRVNERRVAGSREDNKKLAYLLDLKTICILDLVLGLTICQVTHDAKVDWLELNETGHKLLFRDKRQRLLILDPRTNRKEPILTNCSFVQWVPGSDVVVAQSLTNLCVWYNIDTPDRVTLFPIKGDVIDVIRADGRTEVVVQDGVQQLGYELDAGLVEFGTAIHDNDLARAVLFLENLGSRPEAEGMWQSLAGIALTVHDLRVAARCYAALGDFAKTYYLQETLRIGEEFGNVAMCPEVWARMAILNKDLTTAEQIYLEQDLPDKAIAMYRGFHKWNAALDLADRKRLPQSGRLREEYLDWLLDSRQEDKVAELKEKDGDFIGAVDLFLKAKQPIRAAKILTSRPYLLENESITQKVVESLMKADQLEHVGELYERMRDHGKALESYRKAFAFSKALDLARRVAPNEVTGLEESWGDHLISLKQPDAAVNHFIEAGKTVKALEAAVAAKRWKEAVRIIQVLDKNVPGVENFYREIAVHLAQNKDYVTAELMYLKGGMQKEAIDMYNKAGMWDRAHQTAQRYLPETEVSSMYLKEAQNLEEAGKLKEAETLYVSIGQPELAIAMFKKRRMFEEMMQLVSVHTPDLVGSTLVALAEELEAGKQFKLAETQYVRAGEWPAAVAMYRRGEMWEDAHRVAKMHGGREAEIQVACVWAANLGGEPGAKLLARLDLLEAAIDYACENYQFEFALEMCKLKLPEKAGNVHYRFALSLEDDEKLTQAEEHFILAGKAKEAISMYVHARQWDDAERVAEKHDKEGLSDVLVAQARHALEQGNFTTIESLLLRAQRPDLLIKNYRDAGMWVDALRVCREYQPSELPKLQALYDREVGNSSSSGTSALLTHAREWEQKGQYKMAIQSYMSASDAADAETTNRALLKAAELTSKFIDSDDAVVLCRSLLPRLLQNGQYGAAARLCLECDMVREAVDAFIAGGEWESARKVAREMDPALEGYVESRYKSYLTASGDATHLADVDAFGALDLLARQGQWSQCLEAAERHGEHVLHKYVAQRATNLLTINHAPLEALQLYHRYGAPAFSQNYNVYKRIANDMLSMSELEGPDSYPHWAMLRNMLASLNLAMGISVDANSVAHHEIETLQLVVHYFAARAAFKEVRALKKQATKISIALLRYADVIPADRAFYEAGEDAKAAGRENEAFVFLNFYLDICEAIEESNPDLIDVGDFSATDFPLEIPIPQKKYLANHPDKHEDVRNWVLAVSMDQKIDQMLSLDERGLYESSLTGLKASSLAALPCVVTGYPVLTGSGRSPVTFTKPGRVANREDWTALQKTAKEAGGSHLQDVITYLAEWCGSTNMYTF